MKRLLACVCCFPILFGVCGCREKEEEYVSKYAVWEHEDRLRERTAEIFAEEIESFEIVNYEVEILYSFAREPIYFMVTLEYAEDYSGYYEDKTVSPFSYIKYTTRYKHFIGYIYKDEYYRGLNGYQWFGPLKNKFREGRSTYDLFGFSNAKKYFSDHGGGIQAVEAEGKLIQLYSYDNCLKQGSGVSPEFHKHGKTHPEQCPQYTELDFNSNENFGNYRYKSVYKRSK